MKISGARSAGPVSAGAGLRQAADGFSAPPTGASNGVAAARMGQTTALAGLDSLLALQETGGPLERRRRAIRRADRMLDSLDGLRLALIDGAPSTATLDALRRAGREARDATGDPGLESLLDQVDLRAAVELAKLELRQAA